MTLVAIYMMVKQLEFIEEGRKLQLHQPGLDALCIIVGGFTVLLALAADVLVMTWLL